MSIKRKTLLAALLAVAALSGRANLAHAQGAVQQFGVVVPNDFASWTRNGIIQDSGVNSLTLNFPTIAQAHLIGNANSTPQPASDTPLTALIDSLGSFAQGDLLYRNSTGWVFLAPGTSGQFLETLGAGANPTWSNVTIPSFTAGAGIGITGGAISISPQVSVALGGTGLTAGVSGGIPYYASTSAMASSAALAQYQIVLGGGAAAAPYSLGSAGTSGQLLQSNGPSANPSWVSAPTGTVTSITAGTGLTGGTITGSGTVACALAGSGTNGCATPDTNAAHFLSGAGTWLTPAGTTPAPLVATSAAFAPGSTSSGTCAQQNTTVTGATTSMVAVTSPNTGLATGWVWSASVSSSNTVTVNICNVTSGALTPASQTYSIRVIP
jgi:hypothetical protein